MEQTCGTCGWSEPRKDLETVDCSWVHHNPTPICLSINPAYMYRNQGVGCLCWKGKEK